MMLTFRDVANMVDATQDVGLGPGGGEKNFPRLCEKHELLHACCSHRQNEFVQTIRRHHASTYRHDWWDVAPLETSHS